MPTSMVTGDTNPFVDPMSIEVENAGYGTSLPAAVTHMMNHNKSTSEAATTMKMDKRLHAAVTSGSVQCLQSVIRETNIDILKQVTPQKHTSIHIAARLGHLKIVEFIHSQCPTLLREVNSLGETALHTAARAGHLDILKFIIDCAKNSSSPRDIERGREEAIDLLRKENWDGNTVIHEAVRNCHVDVVKLLMQEDPELLQTVNKAGESPLYLAVEMMDKSMVEQILESPHLCYKGRNGSTALHAAVIHGMIDISKLLLEKTPELGRVADDNNRIPLHFASALGSLRAAKVLLQYDPSTSYLLDKFESAPVHLAARFGRSEIIRELILTQPDITELLDGRGRNILHIAVESMKVDVVKYILKEEALEELLNARDIDGNTPLHQAAISGNPFTVCLLHEDKRVDKLALNTKSETAMAIAKSKLDESNELEEARIWVLSCFIPKKGGFLYPAYHQYQYQYHHRQESVVFLRKKWASLYPNESVKSLQKKSNALLVVVALVATVTFAAGFTPPGGTNNDSGSPNSSLSPSPSLSQSQSQSQSQSHLPGTAILQDDLMFKDFVMLDSLALSLSVVSAMFLLILQFTRDEWTAKCMVTFAYFTIGVTLFFLPLTFAHALDLVSTINVSLLGSVFSILILFLIPIVLYVTWYPMRFWTKKWRYRNFGCNKEKVSVLLCYDP